MLKLTKVSRELFENENVENGYYVSIRFRRGMWDVYISDDVKEVYATDTFLDFRVAHEWCDHAIHSLMDSRRGVVSTIAWMD